MTRSRIDASARSFGHGSLVAAVVLVAACGAGTSDTTEAPAAGSSSTSMASAPVTAAPATTAPATILTTTTTSTTTTTLPSVSGLLIATDGGIDLVGEGSTTVVFRGRSVDYVMADLTGGVIFQETESPESGFPPQPVPIERVPAPGAEAVVVVDGSGANRLVPLQVALIQDRPQLLYRRMTYIDEDDQIEHLVMRDLGSDTERVLGILGAYESDWTTVDVGGDRVAVTWLGYGGEGACVGMTDLTALLDLEEDDWIGAACDDSCCTYGPTPGRVRIESGSVRAALDRDGTSLLVSTVENDGIWHLDRIDLATDIVGRVTDHALTDQVWPVPLDFDGTNALIGFRSGDGTWRVVEIDGQGELTELTGARSASFWTVAP